tara:strand:- start:795 stop:989 length:195 start_codon:yes stop_codon:yes gene_type:complete
MLPECEYQFDTKSIVRHSKHVLFIKNEAKYPTFLEEDATLLLSRLMTEGLAHFLKPKALYCKEQ